MDGVGTGVPETGMSEQRIQAEEASRLLGSWAVPGGMLTPALADGLGRLIGRGDIPVGCLLPTQRGLSRELGVSRVTVDNAYETLRTAGLVDGAWQVVACRGPSRPDGRGGLS